MRKRRNASVNPDVAPKREIKVKAKTTKQEHKVALTYAKAEKAQAVSNKRKWTFMLIALVLSAAAFMKFRIGG